MMSYCRWSSDDFKCDLYIYEHVGGFWALHVAGRRHVHTPPPTYEYPEEHKKYFDESKKYFDESKKSFSLTKEGSEAWLKWEEENNSLVDIDLPHAGETFELSSPGEAADKAEELRALGYHVPQYAIDRLREEQQEFDQVPRIET
jgi:hypothetical protein